jgi:predicted ferric reductase
MIRQKYVWAFVYLMLMLLPVVVGELAAGAAGLEPRPWLDEWASGLGMIGFALVLLSFFLLGRFKPLSGWLGSDLLMQTHQLFGRTALLLLLLHPFFYTLWRAPLGPADASATNALRIGGGSWGLATGLLALGCLLVLVGSAVMRQRSDLPYERWRLLHSGLALAVLGFGLHHTLVSGRYAQLGAVAAVWWVLAALALLSWLWVYLVRPLWQGVQPYRVEKLERCADRIWLLEIAPRSPGNTRFRAGQFAWLKLGHRWPHRDNPFSISNAPVADGRLQFLIKEAGDMTGGLAKHAVGETAFLDGPHGRFDIPSDAPAVVMHAGGIGVAPFVSLLADAVARQERRPLRLLYADKHCEQMVDVLALSGAAALPDFQLLPMVEQAGPDWRGLTGRLDAKGLAQALSHPAVAPLTGNAYHLVCGPEPMMDAVETALVARGVPAQRVLSEHFSYSFSGRSPLARRMLQAWWLLSAASLLGLVLILAQERLWRLFGGTA